MTYRWVLPGKSEPALSYHFCSVCGVRTHGFRPGPEGAPTIAVQIATLEDADRDVLASNIQYVDGRHDMLGREPEDVRLL